MRAGCWLLAIVACAGCRGFFDPHGGNDGGGGGGDSAVDTASGGSPHVVNQRMAANGTGTLTTPTLTIQAGDLIVVGVVTINTAVVTGVSDGAGNTYVSTGARPTAGSVTSEIWFAQDSKPATTSVTVELNVASGASVWLLEVSGMNTSAPLDAAATNTAVLVDLTVMGPPLTTTVPNELVFDAGALFNANLTGLAAADGFDALAIDQGNNAAYLIAPTPGTYAPTWSTDGFSGTACIIAASFKPAP